MVARLRQERIAKDEKAARKASARRQAAAAFKPKAPVPVKKLTPKQVASKVNPPPLEPLGNLC